MLLRSDCPVGFSQTRNSLKVSQPWLENDLLSSRPLWACSHLENRELSCSGRAHCVRWVAQLYQKTSLVLSRWMRQASSTGRPEAFTCPATLDRTGLPEAFICPVPLDRPGRPYFVYKLPEAFTRPTAFGWPGRLDFLRLCLSSL